MGCCGVIPWIGCFLFSGSLALRVASEESKELYVVEKDVNNNVIFVSRNYYSVDKRRRLFRVGSLKWLRGFPPSQINQLRCKVRHGPGFYTCSLKMELSENGHDNIAVVHLNEDDQGLAAGQFAAFYDGTICIGSGIILESWDDQGFPVCSKALEIARLEDKSELGKPVKIKVRPDINLECDKDDFVVLSPATNERLVPHP